MDIESIKALLELVADTDVSELEYEDEDVRIAVRRGAPPGAPAYMAAPMMAAAAQPAIAGPGAAGVVSGGGKTVESPFVGTFYRAASPDSAPYADVGQRVSKGQTLCIVEAMKLMNEIECEVNGTVRQILVDNAQPVEFGQALFIVDPD